MRPRKTIGRSELAWTQQSKSCAPVCGFRWILSPICENFAELAEPLVALTRKGAPFVWTDEPQTAFDALEACLLSAPILGFPTEEGQFVLDTDVSLLFAVGGVLNQIQNEEEVVIAYASRSLRISQRRYCATRREMNYL